MSRFDLSYQILTGEERKLLVAENLIKTAQWLEKQGIVCCTQEYGGVCVQLNLEGIDSWIRNKFNELGVDWKILRPGIYGIAAQNREPMHVVEDNQDAFLFHYKSLFIAPLYAQFTQQPKNVIVQFADIFCEKVDLHRLIRTVATGKNVEFVLEWKNETLYLNEQRILTRFPARQKAIMQVLIDAQNSNKYVSWDEIAARVEEKSGLCTDDIHDQIYKPMNVLQSNVMKKFPKLMQSSNFIEFGKTSCRLSLTTLHVDKIGLIYF